MTTQKDRAVILPKGNNEFSEWLDLNGFPTDRTLWIVCTEKPTKGDGPGAVATGLCQIDVSPDKETVVTMQQTFNSDKAAFLRTEFDYRYARVRKAHNHPTPRDAQGGGGGWNQTITNSFGWKLVASAADEAERDDPSAAAPARVDDAEAIDLDGPTLALPASRLVEVSILMGDSRGPILFFGRAHTALRQSVQLDPVQPREAREFSAEIVDGHLRVWGSPSTARVWIRTVG